MNEITNQIIVSANLFFLASAVYGLYSAVRWYIRNKITPDTEGIVISWIWIFSAITINVGWFYFSRVTSPPDVIWNTFMFEWRWAMISVTALMFGYGMYQFETIIEPARKRIHKCAFALVLAGCVIAGQLWH